MITDPYPPRCPVPGETVTESKRRQLRTKRARRRALLAQYKAKHGCRSCGERDPVVLDLHHTKGGKLGVLADSHVLQWSITRLNAELAKCDVLCANYHRHTHHNERTK